MNNIAAPFNRCKLCLSSKSTRLLPLTRTERKFVDRVFCKSDQKIQKICEICLLRVHNFRQLLMRLWTQRLNKTILNVVKMESEQEDVKVEPEKPHDFNCSCDACRKKHGDLPLLIEVIEQKNQLTTPDTKNEPQPSTSREPHGKKIMTCEHCKKTFTHRGDLNKHLRKHTKEQPFKCSVCQRKFAHTSNLQRHLKIHSGARPFSCSVCGKSFSRKDKLDCHKKSKYCKEAANSSL